MPTSRRRRPPLAKLTPPRLPHILERPRLLARLDQARTRPVVWVMGPPGMGKTTLVADYVARRNVPCLWYQLDQGDGDVATFFHYLGLAMQTAARGRRKPLPHFTAEYRMSLNTFARRFFEELYGRLTIPCALVLDNYHDLLATSPVHEVLEAAFERVPEGVTWVCVSRELPPPAFAKLQARQAMHLFDPDALRLTSEEAVELVKLHSKQHGWQPPGRLVEQMRIKTSGWLAGLVLLVENARFNDSTHDAGWTETPEVVFDYLAREVMKGIKPEVRDFLLKTAFLHAMTETMAEKLTGLSTAGRVLRRLYQMRHFTERRLEKEPVYQYHPLFRDFLQREARQHLSGHQLRDVQQAAAKLLEEAGQIESAVALLETAGATPELLHLVLAQAPILMAQGRIQTLDKWLKNLPASLVEQTPWALFWLGATNCFIDHEHGQRLLNRAFEGFKIRDDRVGMLSAACGIVESIMSSWVNISKLESWIDRLRSLASEDSIATDLEARVSFAFFMAQQWRDPKETAMGPLADRVESMLQRDIDPGQAMLFGFYLVIYKCWMSEYDTARRIVRVLHQINNSKTMSPLAKMWLKVAESSYAFATGDIEQCIEINEHCLQLVSRYGLESVSGILWANGAQAALAKGDLTTAEKYRAKTPPDFTGLLDHISGWLAVLRGDLYEAWKHIDTALQVCLDMQIPFPEAWNRIAAAQVLHEQGKRAEAIQHLARAKQIGDETGCFEIKCRCDLLEAQFAFNHGDEQKGRQYLRRAMALASSKGIVNWLWWRPSVMAHLCAKALEADIEIDYVRHVIKKRKLTPGPSVQCCSTWPWPVKIRMFGKFEITVNEEPIRFSRKTQQRPLDLLKVLVTLGGEEVSETSLTDTLWPDAEGDAAHQTFATTLHRLRKLIGMENLELTGGRLSLMRQSCFVDVWAFERLLEQADPEKALALYAGPFLGDEPAPWAESLRERLRRKLVRAVLQIAQDLERSGQTDAAVNWIARGLEIEPMAEELRVARQAQRLQPAT